MSKSKIDILKVSKLANLPVGTKEKEVFKNQLIKILDHIDQIEKADTKSIDPTYNVSSNTNITRSDIASRSLTQEKSLQNAPQSQKGFFQTKGVFEND